MENKQPLNYSVKTSGNKTKQEKQTPHTKTDRKSKMVFQAENLPYPLVGTPKHTHF